MAINFAESLKSYADADLQKLKSDLLNIPNLVHEVLLQDSKIHQIAKQLCNERDMYFIGRGADYYVAMEGALKLKEISYIHAESYASGELKHGTIALIEDGIHVISIITNPLLVEKSISNVQEVITRGAKNIIITNQNIDKNAFDTVIEIPAVNPLLSPLVSVIPLQLLAYYTAKEKGLDVDKPRNLAKSVTVE